MSPSLVKHLFAHSSGSTSHSLPHSPVTRVIDEVDGEPSWLEVVSGPSSTLGNMTDREAYENDRRTAPRSRWNLNTWLDRLRLHSRDDPAVDLEDEANGQISPSTSLIDEIPISKGDRISVVDGSAMGPTGLGKTTFIDRAVGNPDAGYGSTSFTKDVRPVRYPHPDGVRSIILVDTPGCNDSMADFQVLGEIALSLTAMQVAYLALKFSILTLSSYDKNIELNGFLYFLPISVDIILETVSRNYNIFKEMCGKDYFKNVIFVTTMWDEVSEEVGSERKQDLRSDFWREMINLGSTSHRFQGTTESAWKIINFLSDSRTAERRRLQIQREMVDDHLPLQLTAAGGAIINRLLVLCGTEFGLSSSGDCGAEGYWSSLAQIRDAITVCLVIALSIQPMTGTHHVFFQVVEIATLLINMLVEHVKQAKQTRISADIKTAIGEFEKEMKGVQDIVRDPAQRTPEARRVLRSTDVRIISSCASSMRGVCDALRSTSSINHDISSINDGFEALKRGIGYC
ncbi:hypothetical protein EDD15DRAFT_2196406 [Pisolithus albus]|nr:hypothetical protein EDD15DRAFT_2196406 [Pisolithus albus]